MSNAHSHQSPTESLDQPHDANAHPPHPVPSSNASVAAKLLEMADLLQEQNASIFRVQAYQHGADTLLSCGQPIDKLLETEGVAGLIALPGIGKSIAAAIVEILHTGHWTQLERLRGKVDPVALLATLPGIGKGLAEQISEELSIDSLESLEVAAYDGRLASLPGIGIKRLAAIRASLRERLSRRRMSRHYQASHPFIKDILDVDAEYRNKAKLGVLTLVAPKRFNPTGKAWLPVLHTRRGEWHFTVLFSNTQRAHALNKTDDWVVVYFQADHHQEGQFTVVTESHGPLSGKRVIRGLESACREFYQ